MLFTKITFFIMYLDIFGQWRWLKICAIVGGCLTAAFYAAMTACLFAFATPGRHETWASHQFSRGTHLDLAFAVPQSCVGLVVDLYILILPIIGVSKLQMATGRKIAVMVVFMSAIL